MIRRYEDIMDSAKANMIAKQDKLTDFNEGSIIHTILDTFARLLERAYVAIRQGYNELLRLIPFTLFGFSKKQGTYASGSVVFSRKQALEAETSIPSGTRLSCDGLIYLTTSTGKITSGETQSQPVPIRADKSGTAYNVAPGLITSIESNVPAEVVSVINLVPVTGGSNEESVQEVDERFKNFINGLSGTNKYAIKNAVLELDSVRSVSIQEHAPPLKDVYNLSVYVDDGSGAANEETLQAAKEAIEGTIDGNGHLAPGINARVLAPIAVPVNFHIAATVFRTDKETAQAEIVKLLTEYTNGLVIGQQLLLSEIVQKIMSVIYVKDVKITTPAENITPTAEQIVRFGSATVDIIEVE